MIKKILPFFLTISLLFSISTSIFAQGTNETADLQTNDELLVSDTTEEGEVVLEAVDKDGKPASETVVTVFDISSGEKSELVLQNVKTDKNGKLKFKTNPEKLFNKYQDRDLVDTVYEVFFVSSNDELQREVFAVSHVRPNSKVSDEEKQKVKDKNLKKVQGKFTSDQPKVKKVATSAVTAAATRPSNCTYLGSYWYECNVSESQTAADAKTAVLNIANGEKAVWNFNTSSKMSLSVGVKRDVNPWSFNGSAAMSTTTGYTSTYNIEGTCKYFTTNVCNLTRDIYLNYLFKIKKRELWYDNTLEYNETLVTPSQFGGTTLKVNWREDGRNGKPSADALNGTYGSRYVVSPTMWQKVSYTKESTYSGGFSVNTLVGTFSGSVTTQYVSGHDYTINVNTGVTKSFVHYDYNTFGKEYFVTS